MLSQRFLSGLTRHVVNSRNLRFITSTRVLRSESAGTESSKPSSPEVQAIVDSILKLNVMQSIELVKTLKTTFGYSDAAFMAAPMGGGGAAPGAQAQAEAVVEEKPKAAEKTSFSIKLESYDAKDKIKVIKEVRAITGKGLKEAKDLVESLPQMLKKDVKKEEADKIVQVLKDAGGVCVLE